MRSLIKIHKNTKPEYLYYEKKRLKCTRSIICTQLVQLAFWRNWDPKYSHPREQINKIVLAQNGVGVGLEAAGLQLFPQPPFCLSSQPTAWDSSQHSVPGGGYEETRCGKPCLTPEIFPPTEGSGLCPSMWSHA